LNSNNDINPQRLARIAGALYFSIIPMGIFSIMYVPKQIFVAGDLAATMANVSQFEALFRSGIFTAILLQIVNVFVALYLHKLLKPVHRELSLLMVLLFVISVPIAIVNEVTHLAILHINQSPDYLSGFSLQQLHGLIGLFNELHKLGIKIATFFWGLWLLPMGLLIYKSSFLPKVLGILLMLGCFGYLFDLVGYFLLPQLQLPSLSIFTSLGELLLPLWLLIRGINVAKWHSVYAASNNTH